MIVQDGQLYIYILDNFQSHSAATLPCCYVKKSHIHPHKYIYIYISGNSMLPGIIGGVVGFAVLMGISYYCYRRRDARRDAQEDCEMQNISGSISGSVVHSRPVATHPERRMRPNTFYHATNTENALRIQEGGFVIPAGPGGLLGRGVYCTSTFQKAMEYLKGPHGGIIFVLKIDLGNCKQLVKNDPMMTTWQLHGFDSAWAPFSAVDPVDNEKEENCIKDPERITIVQALAGNTHKLRLGGFDIVNMKLEKMR